MATNIKICGLSIPEALLAALEARADFVGLVHFEKSPRHVDLTTAAQLAALARGRAKVVTLLVDPEDHLVRQVRDEVKPDYIQLHGRESPERTAAVATLSGLSVIKAIGVATREDIAEAEAYRATGALVMFDAKPPPAATRPGGNGEAFDWGLLDDVAGRYPFMLSGGLDPANVGAAVRRIRPWAVDVSSGVESRPGVKDVRKIRDFIAAVRAADTTIG